MAANTPTDDDVTMVSGGLNQLELIAEVAEHHLSKHGWGVDVHQPTESRMAVVAAQHSFGVFDRRDMMLAFAAVALRAEDDQFGVCVVTAVVVAHDAPELFEWCA